MSAAFDRLSATVQHQIVDELRFTSLRPVQEMAIEPVLDGMNCVVIAPTAGGKTEAAVFPLLSQMDEQAWPPVSVLYVAPLRALLNNQEHRLERCAKLVGRSVFKWHGDVTRTLRRRFVDKPADILLTTPESLEVMLMSNWVPARKLFKNLRAVVIDEVHAFVADDRGGHLASVFERLSRICGRDVQRIGLSATVGNPEDILSWLAGSSVRPGVVVEPERALRAAKLTLDYVGSTENAAKVVAELYPGTKRLVFAESRATVEELGAALVRLGVNTQVAHSALSRERREDAERAFASERDCVIVATSALELGIDIGDLDHVFQVDCPGTVASLLQRMGRSGRRSGLQANCTFLATEPRSLIQAAALVRLYRAGFVEPLPLRKRSFHLLAHQLMALAIQEHGVPLSDWWGWISKATPFAEVSESNRAELLQHMVDQQIVAIDAGRIRLAPGGERLYGFRHFQELFSVFSTPESFAVRQGDREIGTLEEFFVQMADPGSFVFTLGAATWRAKQIDWQGRVVQVEPLSSGGITLWRGQPRLMGRELCEAIRAVLTSAGVDLEWTQRARACVAEQRAKHQFLKSDGWTPQQENGEARLWTFAGGRANGLLAKVLSEKLGSPVSNDNLFVACRGASAAELHAAASSLAAEGRPSQADALRLAERMGTGRTSKFRPCLTDRLAAECYAEL